MSYHIKPSAVASLSLSLDKILDLESSLQGKQDTLVSGTTIKTINGNSVLGSGDIEIPPEIVNVSEQSLIIEGNTYYDDNTAKNVVIKNSDNTMAYYPKTVSNEVYDPNSGHTLNVLCPNVLTIDEGYFLTDSNGNIGLLYTEDGLDVAKLSSNLENKIANIAGTNAGSGIIRLANADDKMGVLKNASSVWFGLISDIHGSGNNLQEFLNFCDNYEINYRVHLGDSVYKSYSDGMTFWTNISGSSNIMNTIGNHDTYSSGSAWWNYAQTASAYNRYIKPFTSNIQGLVLPDDADSTYKCYYYVDLLKKDDETQSDVRYIVLDCMSFTNDSKGLAQYTWLNDILADSLTNNKHVLIGSHFPCGEIDKFDTAFCWPWDDLNITLVTLSGALHYLDLDYSTNKPSALILSYIDQGLIFIGWICGHTHLDFLGTLTGYPKLLQIGVPSSRGDYTTSGTSYHPSDTLFDHCFSVIGINTTRKWILLLRIGKNRDGFGRVRDSFCYVYDTNYNKLING